MHHKILYSLRGDNNELIKALETTGKAATVNNSNVASTVPFVRCAFPNSATREAFRPFMDGIVPGPLQYACGIVDQILDSRPEAVILWNTVLPEQAAAAIAARSLGIPVYEIQHSRLGTPLVGHFERGSLATKMVCSPHMAEVMTEVDSPWTIGCPVYDNIFPRVPKETGDDRKKILVTGTYGNDYHAFTGPEIVRTIQEAVLSAMSQCSRYFVEQGQEPPVFIWSVLRNSADAEMLDMFRRFGVDPECVLLPDTEDIFALLEAADAVLCPRSGVAVDGLAKGHRPVVVDTRPFSQGDYQGIYCTFSPVLAAQELYKAAYSPPVKLSEGQERYWGIRQGTIERIMEDLP